MKMRGEERIVLQVMRGGGGVWAEQCRPPEATGCQKEVPLPLLRFWSGMIHCWTTASVEREGPHGACGGKSITFQSYISVDLTC